MTHEQIKKILEDHLKWINDEPGGKRADLRGLDLRGLNLSGIDLRGIDLRGVDLRGVGSNTFKPENLGLEHETNTDLLRSIAEKVVQGNCDMHYWHLCETTHCLAGWAVHLSGASGYALEATTSPSVAGCLLVPEISHLFFKGNKEVEQWAEEFLEKEDAA